MTSEHAKTSQSAPSPFAAAAEVPHTFPSGVQQDEFNCARLLHGTNEQTDPAVCNSLVLMQVCFTVMCTTMCTTTMTKRISSDSSLKARQGLDKITTAPGAMNDMAFVIDS